MLEVFIDIFVLFNHIEETSVVFANVKADVPVQLAQTDRAEVQVVLLMFHLFAVAPTHHAVEEGTVLHAKHVSNLVQHGLD